MYGITQQDIIAVEDGEGEPKVVSHFVNLQVELYLFSQIAKQI